VNEKLTDDDRPASPLYDRPIPDFVEVDVDGLIEAWLMQAEDWLVAYDGPDALTDREAFEGIECLARLSRMRPELRGREGVRTTIEKLTAALQPLASDVVRRAVRYPDLVGWRAQVEEAWTAADDDPELAETLISDLDAADWVPWFATQHAKSSVSSDPFHRYLEELGSCHDLFHQHVVMFCAAEAFVRAVGKTLAEEFDSDDGGWLTSSNWKYLHLLNELDVDIESISEETRRLVLGLAADSPNPVVRLPDGPQKMGPQEAVWRVHELAPSLGAAIPELRALESGFRWRDPTGSFEAEVTWPIKLEAEGDKTLELMFGTGEKYTMAAEALAGQEVRLGNAVGFIEISGEGDIWKASAVVTYGEVTKGLNGELGLSVAGTPWIFHNAT